MRSVVVCGSVVALVSVGLPVIGAGQSVSPPAAQDRAAENGEYRIGPEDVLQIIVWKNDTLTRNVSVRPDGMISMPLLDDIQASGRTTRELRELLTKKLADYVAAPEVSVVVTDVRSMKVSVIGEVPRPGRYELKSKATVLDVLAMAGGFSQLASRTRIVVLRPDGEKMKRIPFNYNKVITAGGEAENFYVQPGDIVVVP
jgi:polysaccharide export outer membrane protein